MQHCKRLSCIMLQLHVHVGKYCVVCNTATYAARNKTTKYYCKSIYFYIMQHCNRISLAMFQLYRKITKIVFQQYATLQQTFIMLQLYRNIQKSCYKNISIVYVSQHCNRLSLCYNCTERKYYKKLCYKIFQQYTTLQQISIMLQLYRKEILQKIVL